MKCSSGSSRYGSIGSVRPWASAAGSSTNAPTVSGSQLTSSLKRASP